MKRRSFLKKTAAATATAFVAPYILPSGRLFAATGSRLANHVVFCLFAGGIRNFESVQKKDGNLLPNMLTGTEPITPDIIGGIESLPSIAGSPLQTMGTLFKEFRYKNGPPGHYNGHSTAITGTYTSNNLNLKQRPPTPTVFEYYRKHYSPAMDATNAWWVSDTLGAYPQLNFSQYPGYGAMYGANYIQPTQFINQYEVLADPKSFSNDEQTRVKAMREFFNNNFNAQSQLGSAGIVNTETGRSTIESFLNTSFSDALSGLYDDPWGLGNLMNNDMRNMFYAEKVLDEFEPELLVVNMQGVDVCHYNFTNYCNNLGKADYALKHLWNTIQGIPGMANDTVLIAVPEHGRNLTPNTQVDSYGRFAYDHTDDSSREIFCLIAGPNGVVTQGQEITSITGESIDVVPTIAHILGFHSDIPPGLLPGRILTEAFV